MTPLFAFVAAALAANPWTSNADEVAAPGWMDEGVLHVSGLSERPLVGGGIARRVSEGGWIGGRFLVPAWGAGPYEGDLFVRGFFTAGHTASLYVEGDFATWMGRDLLAPSIGASLGVSVRVHPRLSVGGSMGPTVFFSDAAPAVDALRLGPVGLVPRMRATVDFLL